MRAIARALLLATLSCVAAGSSRAQVQEPGSPTNRDTVPEQYVPPNAPDDRGNPADSKTMPKPPPQDLDRSGGVIAPPPVEDQGAMPPPNQGTSRTPVIGPPKTPGGDLEVKPK